MVHAFLVSLASYLPSSDYVALVLPVIAAVLVSCLSGNTSVSVRVLSA